MPYNFDVTSAYYRNIQINFLKNKIDLPFIFIYLTMLHIFADFLIIALNIISKIPWSFEIVARLHFLYL